MKYKKKNIITKSGAQTKALARQMAKSILKEKPADKAKIVALVGKLGAGKTTFIQGFLRALGVKSKIISPTFLIMRPYVVKKSGFTRAYHVDAYRLNFQKELIALGFKKIIADPKNIVLIEWADKIKKLLPKNVVWLQFKYGKKENERIIAY